MPAELSLSLLIAGSLSVLLAIFIGLIFVRYDWLMTLRRFVAEARWSEAEGGRMEGVQGAEEERMWAAYSDLHRTGGHLETDIEDLPKRIQELRYLIDRPRVEDRLHALQDLAEIAHHLAKRLRASEEVNAEAEPYRMVTQNVLEALYEEQGVGEGKLLSMLSTTPPSMRQLFQVFVALAVALDAIEKAQKSRSGLELGRGG